MRACTETHQYNCGIDLHARMLYVCIVDQHNDIRLHRKVAGRPSALLKVLEPLCADMVVARSSEPARCSSHPPKPGETQVSLTQMSYERCQSAAALMALRYT